MTKKTVNGSVIKESTHWHAIPSEVYLNTKHARTNIPLDSLRASAAWMVVAALASKLRSSKVSTRSVFQIKERSVTCGNGELIQLITVRKCCKMTHQNEGQRKIWIFSMHDTTTTFVHKIKNSPKNITLTSLKDCTVSSIRSLPSASVSCEKVVDWNTFSQNQTCCGRQRVGKVNNSKKSRTGW